MARVAFIVGDYPSEESARREQVAVVRDAMRRSRDHPGADYAVLPRHEMTLVAPTVIEAFRAARQQGYDAVVPLGFLDLGVDGGCAAVDIPVIGPCEAASHIAALLGDRFGLIAYHENLCVPKIRFDVDAGNGRGKLVA